MQVGHALVLEVSACQTIGDAWNAALQRRGFVLDRARTALEALQLLTSSHHHVTFLHRLASSSDDAMALGRTLRQLKPSLGIVLLGTNWETAERRHLIEEFADECLDLHSEVEELLAVLTALGRRAQGSAAQVSCRLSRGALRLDFIGGFVAIDGKEITLQPLQMRILACLVQHSGTVVSNDRLQQQVFRVPRISSTSISRQICVLRRQLGTYGLEITTAEGGYGLGLA
jgi:DNA-binding response OmpR family regulator